MPEFGKQKFVQVSKDAVSTMTWDRPNKCPVCVIANLKVCFRFMTIPKKKIPDICLVYMSYRIQNFSEYCNGIHITI